MRRAPARDRNPPSCTHCCLTVKGLSASLFHQTNHVRKIQTESRVARTRAWLAPNRRHNMHSPPSKRRAQQLTEMNVRASACNRVHALTHGCKGAHTTTLSFGYTCRHLDFASAQQQHWEWQAYTVHRHIHCNHKRYNKKGTQPSILGARGERETGHMDRASDRQSARKKPTTFRMRNTAKNRAQTSRSRPRPVPTPA